MSADGPAQASLTVIEGAGGDGVAGAKAAAGASVTLTNLVTATSATSTMISQTATAGASGSSRNFAGLVGGEAVSILNGVEQTAPDTFASSTANGGAGGAGVGGGTGGSATAIARRAGAAGSLGAGSVVVYATARAGDGGDSIVAGRSGDGGTASAIGDAVGAAPGPGGTQNASANAMAQGGAIGGTADFSSVSGTVFGNGGAANAEAKAVTIAGDAFSNAAANGGGGLSGAQSLPDACQSCAGGLGGDAVATARSMAGNGGAAHAGAGAGGGYAVVEQSYNPATNIFGVVIVPGSRGGSGTATAVASGTGISSAGAQAYAYANTARATATATGSQASAGANASTVAYTPASSPYYGPDSYRASATAAAPATAFGARSFDAGLQSYGAVATTGPGGLLAYPALGAASAFSSVTDSPVGLAQSLAGDPRMVRLANARSVSLLGAGVFAASVQPGDPGETATLGMGFTETALGSSFVPGSRLKIGFADSVFTGGGFENLTVRITFDNFFTLLNKKFTSPSQAERFFSDSIFTSRLLPNYPYQQGTLDVTFNYTVAGPGDGFALRALAFLAPPSAVPEPPAVALLGIPAALFAIVWRRRGAHSRAPMPLPRALVFAILAFGAVDLGVAAAAGIELGRARGSAHGGP